MKRLITVVAAAALTVSAAVFSAPAQAASGGVATAADSASQPYVPPPISWGACSDPTLVHYGAQCGMLAVPLDYAHPHGTLIHLAVSRVKHTTPQSAYQGVMLVNPGGPGRRRLDRIRPARGRVERPGAVLRRQLHGL